ncbi:MAG TPA: ABC transporter permease [Vicinamibacterales bacterium]|nr:ABC transporter permease [Vicinamibacterales bacterium]
MDALLKDLVFGTRALLRSRWYTAVVVLTLGLGIGANTAIFSVITGVLLRPLPYQESDRLVLLRQSAPLAGTANIGVSIKEYFTYREQARDVGSLVEYHQMSFDLLKRGDPDRVSTGVVSHNFFDVLGVQPIHGRTFSAADDKPGAEAVLVLGHSYWRSRFGADPGIVGQAFEMNGRPHTVIGVLPNVPMFPQENDVYMPVLVCPFRAGAERNIGQNPRIFAALTVFGRLRDGVLRDQASREVGTIGSRLAATDTQAYRPDRGFAAALVDVRDQMTQNARPMLMFLLGTTGLVLLLACANVANLTLARLLRRDREIAVRTALGAGRARIFRQLLTESLLLAGAGGAAGVLFAILTLGMLTRFIGRFTQRTQEIAIDPWVLGFTLLLSLIAGVLFGVIPALTAPADPNQRLRQGGKGTSIGAPRARLQSVLVVTQVAVSVVLLSAAGLLLASFVRLQRVEPGFRTEGVVSAETFGNFRRYPDIQTLLNFYLPVLDRLPNQAGIVSAAITNAVPLSTIAPIAAPFRIEGRDTGDTGRGPTSDVRVVSERYFDTLGIPLLQGRVFQPSDDADAPLVVVINRSMARYWDGRDPIGARVSYDGGQNWATVVGVVGDVRLFGLDQDATAQVYTTLRQQRNPVAGRVLVRTQGSTRDAAAAIRSVVGAIDPNMPIENVQTLEELRDQDLATPRLTATLISVFAALAFVVTLTGITGVIATSVSHRTQEFGVRMALGAQRSQVLRMILRQGLTLVVGGLALGIAGSILAGRALTAYLYRTSPADPAALAFVAVAFLIAGGLACLGPAWRATTVDPLIALRAD